MYVWVLLTLLIDAQTSAIGQGEFRQQNVFLNFRVNKTDRDATDKTADSILTSSLTPSSYTSMYDLKLKNGYGSNNEFQWNLSAIGTSMLNDIDKTVGNVLRNFLTPSSYASMYNFKLKNGYGSNNQFYWNVSAIGSSILNDIEKLSETFGIAQESKPGTWKPIQEYTTISGRVYSTTVYNTNMKSRWNRSNFVDSIYHELYRFPQKLIPLASRTLSKVREYFRKNDYIRKGYVSRESETSRRFPMHNNTPSGLLIPTFIKNWKHYIVGARQCMSSPKSYFNLPKAVIDVMKYSPRTAAMIVRNRFNKPVPRHPASKKKIYTGYEAMTCQTFANTIPNYYECLKELRRVSACVTEKTKKSAEPNALREYHRRKFWPSALRLVKSVQELDNSCKVDKKTSTITCSLFSRSKTDSNVGMNVSNHLGWSPAGAEAQKIAQQMIEVMLKNQLGADILDEIGTCVYIYQRGASAQHKLRKMSRNHPGARQMYVKVNKTLETYKHHLIRIALGAVNDVRSMFTTVEGTLVKSMSEFLGIDFSEHMKSMRCLDELLDAIMGPWLGDDFWGDGDKSKPDQPNPEQPKPEQSKPEQPKPEQLKPEQPKPKQPKQEQLKPEQQKPEQPKPEQLKPDQSNPNLPPTVPTPEVQESTEPKSRSGMRSYENKSYHSSESSSMFDDSDDPADSSDETDKQLNRSYSPRGVIPREEAARKLMNSLKRLSQTKMLRKQSTIASLANTFLLATMFYECITVLAAAVYRTELNTGSEPPTVPSTPIYQAMTTPQDQDQSWEHS
ncbi:uncharacterized protein LOC107048748 [Diachasma alloeum]|uniref:uncharacterized protein LOC107048748 n=1 Tax=Diachasma alloeum TaxID=454923 RepID=UPI00073831C3|nr:uncharacterized protein LOC107048748 [Diachasma alloeum]